MYYFMRDNRIIAQAHQHKQQGSDSDGGEHIAVFDVGEERLYQIHIVATGKEDGEERQPINQQV